MYQNCYIIYGESQQRKSCTHINIPQIALKFYAAALREDGWWGLMLCFLFGNKKVSSIREPYFPDFCRSVIFTERFCDWKKQNAI